MIAIVDYGLGNLRSIQNMLRKVGVASVITRDTALLERAERLILPGVGNFGFAMALLRELRLINVLHELVLVRRKPVLGICLGAQLLGRHSEEGDCDGLGWLAMKTVAFDRTRVLPPLKVPHMGWAETKPTGPGLLDGLPPEARFYYVHSYHFVCEDPEMVACVATHGYEFASGVKHGNVCGMQFHPEKSHVFGMHVMKNFAAQKFI